MNLFSSYKYFTAFDNRGVIPLNNCFLLGFHESNQREPHKQLRVTSQTVSSSSGLVELTGASYRDLSRPSDLRNINSEGETTALVNCREGGPRAASSAMGLHSALHERAAAGWLSCADSLSSLIHAHNSPQDFNKCKMPALRIGNHRITPAQMTEL